jgi:hypothetical protein
MKNSWLVQRLLKPVNGWEKNPFIFGCGYKNGGLSNDAMNLIKSIFQFDYMGAAEFEFGALPEALNKIAKYANEKTLIKGYFKPSRKYKKTVSYICNKEHEEYVKTFIKSLLSRKPPILKESTCLDVNIEGKEYAQRYCGWLEFDNGFFFFTDEDMFNDTCKLFGVE